MRSMGGLRGGVTGGLENSNTLIIMCLAKNRGGLAKRLIIHNSQLIIHNSQLGFYIHSTLNAKHSTLNIKHYL